MKTFGKTCKECHRPTQAKGLCTKHYTSLRRHGTVHQNLVKYNIDVSDDFWLVVDVCRHERFKK